MEVVALRGQAQERLARAPGCRRTFDRLHAPVCLSGDGRFALSGSEDKTLKLWALDWELGDEVPVPDTSAASRGPFWKRWLGLGT